MGDRIHLAPVEQEHVDYLSTHLSDQDTAEIVALGFSDARAALEHALHRSDHVWAVLLDEEPVMLFGVSPKTMLSNTGVPWALGSGKLRGAFIEAARKSRRLADYMLELYPYLENYVDARHTTSVKWLKFCGFTIHPAEPYGVNGELFHKFDRGEKWAQ